jgi:ribosomal protein S27E
MAILTTGEIAVKCRNCGTDNPDDASLCAKCGATLPSVSGSRALIPEESFESPILAAVCVIGFLMIVAGAWIVGGTLGAGIFLAILGAVLLTVAFVYFVGSGRKLG